MTFFLAAAVAVLGVVVGIAHSTIGERRIFRPLMMEDQRGVLAGRTAQPIMRDGHVIEDIAWCYGEPAADAEGIGGRIAFDPRHVEFQTESAPEDRVLRHVPAHDPPYADDLDPMERREV